MSIQFWKKEETKTNFLELGSKLKGLAAGQGKDPPVRGTKEGRPRRFPAGFPKQKRKLQLPFLIENSEDEKGDFCLRTQNRSVLVQ